MHEFASSVTMSHSVMHAILQVIISLTHAPMHTPWSPLFSQRLAVISEPINSEGNFTGVLDRRAESIST